MSALWATKLLRPDLKWTQLNMSRENIVICYADPNSFLWIFVTMDESWVHHFQLEMKQQSKQWTHRGSLPPMKAKTVMSTCKVMASPFCMKSAFGGQPRQVSHYHHKTAKGENQANSGQCSSTHIHSVHGYYPKMWMSSCQTPTLFS